MTAELVPVETQSLAPSNLFGIDNPVAIIASATAKADALAKVIKQKQLYKTISGRDHVLVEGWTLLGSLVGVFPVCVWSRPVEPDGWEARVEARTMDGHVVGAAESQCTRAESLWSKRDDFALRSMAQTRATAKALRLPLGFIMALAGYDATPAEEMMHDDGPTPARPQPQRAPQRPQHAPTPRSAAVDKVIEGEVRDVTPVKGDITEETTEAVKQAYLACKAGRGADPFKEEVYVVLSDKWPHAFKGTSNDLAALSEVEGKMVLTWLQDQTPFAEEAAQPSMV